MTVMAKVIALLIHLLLRIILRRHALRLHVLRLLHHHAAGALWNCRLALATMERLVLLRLELLPGLAGASLRNIVSSLERHTAMVDFDLD